MTLARHNLVVQDEDGNIIDGASVEVRHETVGQPLATLKPNRDGSGTLANPFTAADGADAGFYVAGGAFQIRIYTGPSGSPTFERIWSYVGIGLLSEADSVIAADVSFNPAGTSLSSTTAQDAIAELDTDVQGAVDDAADALAAAIAASGNTVTKSINGLLPSNNVSTPLTKLDISAGNARSSDLTTNLTLPAGITKAEGAWSSVPGGGFLDSGSTFANSTGYHVHLIYKPGATPSAWVTSHAYSVDDRVTETGVTYWCITAHTSGTFATDLAAGKWGLVTDAVCSTSATAPTLPSGYTKRRRIGAFITNSSGDILPGLWRGDGSFRLVTPFIEVNGVASNTLTLQSLHVPLGVKLEVNLTVGGSNTVDSTAAWYIIADPDVGAIADDTLQWRNAQLYKVGGTTISAFGNIREWTDASGRVYYWGYPKDADNLIFIYLLGWLDLRDEFS